MPLALLAVVLATSRFSPQGAPSVHRQVQLWDNEAGRVALVTHSHVIAMRRLDAAARFITDAPRVRANPPDSWPGANVWSRQQWERGEASPSSFGSAV